MPLDAKDLGQHRGKVFGGLNLFVGEFGMLVDVPTPGDDVRLGSVGQGERAVEQGSRRLGRGRG